MEKKPPAARRHHEDRRVLRALEEISRHQTKQDRQLTRIEKKVGALEPPPPVETQRPALVLRFGPWSEQDG